MEYGYTAQDFARVAADGRLSARSRGVMAYLMTLPSGAPMGAESISDAFPEGRDALVTSLRELRECGYLRRTRTGTGISGFPENPGNGISGNGTTGISGNGEVPITPFPENPGNGFSGIGTTGFSGDGEVPVPENPSMQEEELLTTSSSPPPGFQRLTERARMVMLRIGIPVSDAWQTAWEQALAGAQGYDPEEHLVNWLLDAESRSIRTRPDLWLRYYRENRDQWLRANAEIEVRASAQESAYRQETNDFLALRRTRRDFAAEGLA
jgi:hypothetical protein